MIVGAVLVVLGIAALVVSARRARAEREASDDRYLRPRRPAHGRIDTDDPSLMRHTGWFLIAAGLATALVWAIQTPAP